MIGCQTSIIFGLKTSQKAGNLDQSAFALYSENPRRQASANKFRSKGKIINRINRRNAFLYFSEEDDD